jgi:hypothetical protein
LPDSAVQTRTVEVKVPVAVQPIKPAQVPAVPAPLGPRPQSLSAAADLLLAKHCEFVAYALKADPLLRLSAGMTDGTTNKVAVGNSPAANTAKSYTGTFVVAATALTRPANTTAYTALDSISNNATAGSVTANSVTLSDTNDHPIDISEILLASTDTGPGTAAIQIRLHLFNSDPTASTGVVGGDNAAWSNKQAGWVGSFSGTMRAFSDGSRGVLIADEGTLRLITPVSGAKTLYWQLQAIGGFTPSANSTTFTPTFKGFQARAAAAMRSCAMLRLRPPAASRSRLSRSAPATS